MNFLHLRANVLAKIRAFFATKNVLEVETPLLCESTITAPYLYSLQVPIKAKQQKMYLQTSPEFAMKKLLAKGSGDIFQICKAFRDEELGKLHNFEFTILEWYRIGFDHHKLMTEMAELLQNILGNIEIEYISYAEMFAKFLNIDCFSAEISDLKKCAEKNGLTNLENFANEDKDTWLEILLTHFIEPHLGKNKITFIYDFPPSQAALAKIRNDNPKVAERFEVYINGVELANGFHELNDPIEQRTRFLDDLKKRQELNLPKIPLDEEFLALLPKMPDCAGVALGVDRLLMILANEKTIQDFII